MESLGGVPMVISITIICFLVAVAVKATKLDNKWLPTICGVLGAILGVVGKLTIPTYPAEDMLMAVAVGIMSGLAATGFHQMVKQWFKNKVNVVIDTNEFDDLEIDNEVSRDEEAV